MSRISNADYTYDSAVETVKQCGFDNVAGLYIENLAANANSFNSYSDGTFSHNMEWITHEAIKVINCSHCLIIGRCVVAMSLTSLITQSLVAAILHVLQSHSTSLFELN